MKKSDFKKLNLRTEKLFRRMMTLLGLMALLLASNSGFGEEPSLTKYQIEAVFLFNFAKYVDWPATAFPNTNAPITIGVLGTDPFGDNLQHDVEGKTINGRAFIVKHLAADSDFSGCQILFISNSEVSRLEGILGKAGTMPILTVGEDEQFAQKNGVISFVLKDGKVRLEIDLVTARKAGLTISSRLLSVADVVKGKAN
jgi:YfiR/HmsC-like